MHCIFLNVPKKLFALLFDGKYHASKFSIRKYLPAINKILLQIKLPKHINRKIINFGPLNVFSCFEFESFNGILKSFVHSPFQPQLQVCSMTSFFLNFETIKIFICTLKAALFQYCWPKKMLRNHKKLACPKLPHQLSHFALPWSNVGQKIIFYESSCKGT